MKKIAHFFNNLSERINNTIYPAPQSDVPSYYDSLKNQRVKVSPTYFNEFATNLQKQIRASYQN